jgi:chromosome segregation ATPase
MLCAACSADVRWRPQVELEEELSSTEDALLQHQQSSAATTRRLAQEVLHARASAAAHVERHKEWHNKQLERARVDAQGQRERAEAREKECVDLAAERDSLQAKVAGLEVELEAARKDCRELLEQRRQTADKVQPKLQRLHELEALVGACPFPCCTWV